MKVGQVTRDDHILVPTVTASVTQSALAGLAIVFPLLARTEAKWDPFHGSQLRPQKGTQKEKGRSAWTRTVNMEYSYQVTPGHRQECYYHTVVSAPPAKCFLGACG